MKNRLGEKQHQNHVFFPLVNRISLIILWDMSLYKIISLIFFDFQCLTIFVSFLVSVLVLRKKNDSMSYFILYTTINVIVMIPLFLITHGFTFFQFADFINNFSILFGFSFLTFMIASNISDKKIRKSLYITSIIFSISIFVLLMFSNNKVPIRNAFALNYVGLILFCVTYLFKLLVDVPEKKLTSISMFWVVLGVLFCSCIAFPITLIFDELDKEELRKYVVLCVAPTFGYSVMHIFLIKAFITHSKNE
jgi:hypothetical protein